ncbi:hypothetical protein POJ06DRAFT_249500 [Lipomyces tetrasporus]|uniref:Uncharacterized protein n=1 Tax=Lipomyces tetrasporus TaxID=54092 RepID=A0AAD7QVZ1_9ASCO|nr:uncharacterized protein POJ06DRAFT_249500 [Lipomyces tetrasporus]KAJ8102360.1 hypothetical protein POJ06DRAFT_249500 [Lipomyces tetrasporus]
MCTLRIARLQDISFFDNGALTFAISKDSGAIESFSAITLDQIISSMIMIFRGVGIELEVAIKLAAVTSPCAPLLLGAGFYKFFLLAKHQESIKLAYGRSPS